MAYNPQLGSEPPVLPVRVFVIASDALAGDGLRATLREDSRFACVASAGQAEVLVWDVGPVFTPIGEHQPLLQGVRAGTQALVVLVPDETAAAHALRSGALAVLQRRDHALSLTAAVMAARLGLCVLDASFAEQYLELPKPSPADSGELDALTAREQEVLEALALGLSNRAIAKRLGVSVHTVKFHANGIFAKLRVDTRAGAVAKGLRNGLLRI